MKILRIALSVIMLIALISCTKDPSDQPVPIKPPIEKLGERLGTLPGVHSVEELASQDYKKYYLIVFKQLLDPKNPAAGTFLQRVFLSHQDFDNPVILEAEGYDAQYCMKGTIQNELTKRYQANYVVVEHRYSGLSLPSSFVWEYLTSENAAADLHAVRVSLGALYTGNWLATGASKGGTNTMSYMMYYPTDLAAAVAYVGPMCNGVSDTRFVTHMRTVATPEMRDRITAFQRELLSRRETIQPVFFDASAQPASSKEYMTDDQAYEFIVTEFASGVWQYGWSVEEIPAADATDQEIINYLIKKDVFGPAISTLSREAYGSGTYAGDYLRKLNVSSTRTGATLDTSKTHYYVQVIMELGTYAHYIEPFEDLIPDHESWSVNTIARFTVPADAADIQFSNKLYLQKSQWLQNQDPHLICVYGEYDPCTATAPDRAYFEGKANMSIFIQEGGAHSAQIEGLDLADKQQAWTKLDKWMKP